MAKEASTNLVKYIATSKTALNFFELLNLSRDRKIHTPDIYGAHLPILSTQPETRKLQPVCFRLVTLQSSGRYQNAFASFTPA